MAELTIAKYTDKSYIVRGDTRKYKDELKKIGGRYIPTPKDGQGPGWMFALTKYPALMALSNIVEQTNEEKIERVDQESLPLPVVKRTAGKVTAVETIEMKFPSRYEYRGKTYQIANLMIELPKIGSNMLAFEIESENESYEVTGEITLTRDEIVYTAYYIPALKTWVLDGHKGILKLLTSQ
jgi:hypothetical protein